MEHIAEFLGERQHDVDIRNAQAPALVLLQPRRRHACTGPASCLNLLRRQKARLADRQFAAAAAHEEFVAFAPLFEVSMPYGRAVVYQ